MYSGIGYSLVEGFRSVFKNFRSSSISIITMICMMFIFGVFFAIGENINSIMEQVQKKQGMEIFIYDETTEEQKSQFEAALKNLDGVNTVTYKNKQMALDSFKERISGVSDSSLFEEYEKGQNIFPASFVITFTDLGKAKEIQEEAQRIGAKLATEKNTSEVDLNIESSVEKNTIIKNIVSKDVVVTTMISLVNGVRIAIFIIFMLLLVFSITIISNTIKLSLHARRKEMSIMKYVGATNSFVRGPYLVEGMLIGLLSAVITILIVGFLYGYIIQSIESSDVLRKVGVNLLQFTDISTKLIAVYAFLGIGLGIVGSSLSMKKYLEV